MEPTLCSGAVVWSASSGRVQARFIGRAGTASRHDALGLAAAAAPAVRRPLEIAWAHQVHSATVLAAFPGECGEGDALIAERPLLALAVATADCVPVLLAAGNCVAAVHAGWRGVTSGVVAAALDRVGAPGSEVEAWIGPAIGQCCYEVQEDVARQIARASAENVVRRSGGPRPRVDLQAAVKAQLERRGVSRIRIAPTCTRCAASWLWSYRRDGRAAGRNFAFVWLGSEA